MKHHYTERSPEGFEGETRERVITQIDPEEMVAESVVVTVPKDPVRRAAMLLAGTKFELNSSENANRKSSDQHRHSLFRCST